MSYLYACHIINCGRVRFTECHISYRMSEKSCPVLHVYYGNYTRLLRLTVEYVQEI